MKRVCTVILAVSYLIFVSGITIYQHYCMDELESVSLFTGENGSCGKCGMERHTALSSGCCKDVSISSSRSDDSHMPTVFAMPNAVTTLLNIFLHGNTLFVSFSHTSVRANTANHPPPIHPSLFLQYQNFRI
ncbi:HYC_CC_PP family protein [Chitinophaga cymbidii]|uniref:HYC_CC_PP family protein n=1 Tax=Chitinophaga cymbidii TaxID=1096750 RepID=UPI003FCE664D